MQPVDLFRRDGTTAYSHDVQVDDDGIAWVSGDGGTRGYYTDGRQWDPVERRYRQATPLEPIPYARRRTPAVGHQRRPPAASSTTPSARSAATHRAATTATARASCC